MTSVPRHRVDRSGCRGSGHQWLTRRLQVRERAHELAVCQECGISTVRVRRPSGSEHRPSHSDTALV